MVIIDTDVLLLAFAFHRDERQAANSDFLDRVKNFDPATTIYNFMELLGQLSFNLSADRLSEWRSWLVDPYNLEIVQPPRALNQNADEFFRSEIFDRPFAKMQGHRMAFLDSLAIGLAERTPNVESFVTWNARHFKNKTPLSVLTPVEYLARQE